VVAFLGAAAVGAIWACCAPDYGAEAVAERLGQLGPRVLVASVRHTFAGRPHDRADIVEELVRRVGAGTLVTVGAEPKWCERVQSTHGVEVISWADAVEQAALFAPALRTEQVPAEHPLWVLFSSGTTGKPKGIVHSHAGIIVTHLELFGLQMDLRPGDAFFWYTTTNWMLWNIVVGALLSGVTTITYDGSPVHPEPDRLWAIAAQEGVRVFGTSPGHLRACAGQDIHPAESYDFSALELVAVTGAPMSPDLAAWVTTAVAPHAMVVSSSGGTDVASSFVGGAPSLRVRDGRIPAAILGVAVATFDENGQAVRDTLAELVVTQPMPSMPLYLWDDTDGVRYRETYFSSFPGVWRHGDWATHTTDGGFEIHGRSDATLNRHGVRIGSADLYTVVESHPAVEEAMVVGVERPGGEYRMPIFIVPRQGVNVDDDVVQELRDRLRSEASPRHVPDEFYVVEALPHTKTGKKLEVPVKRILQGARPEQACSPGSLDRPELLEFYADLARQWEAG